LADTRRYITICHSTKSICLFLACLLGTSYIHAQNFINPDLNGSIFSFSSLPDNWEKVEVGDPTCQASNPNVGDTPDLCSLSQPDVTSGVCGIPFSGNTYVTGLRMQTSVSFQEGIKQTLNGLTVGQPYTIAFSQAVVKQIFALDQVGSWAVYKDNDFLAITAPSTSPLDILDPNIIWEERTVDFIATATSHTIKFLPEDDDSNISQSLTNSDAALRMGIDNINLITDCNLNIGLDIALCSSSLPMTITSNVSGAYLWNTGDTTESILVSNAGTYILEVTSSCGILMDTLNIDIINPPEAISLGPDIDICQQDLPIMLTAEGIGSYFWSTLDTTQSIEANIAGVYYVNLFNDCGSVTDTIVINQLPSPPMLDIGPDLFACIEDFPLMIDAGTTMPVVWSTGETAPSIAINSPGIVTVSSNNSCGSSMDEINITQVDPPEEISLGPDITVCQDQVPVLLAIDTLDLEIEWSDGSTDPMLQVYEEGIVSVDVSNLCGASSSDISIDIIPNEIVAESFVLCQGESVDFLGNTFNQNGFTELISEGIDGACNVYYQISVDVIETDTSYVQLEISQNEPLTFMGEVFYSAGIYYLWEESDGNCDKLIRLQVSEKKEVFVYVPSAYSPNNDGLNEIFKPSINVAGDVRLNQYNFEIYDRYGQVVFETMDEQLGWNGSGPNRKDQYVPDGIYTWVLNYSSTASSERIEQKGTVLLKR